MNLTDEMKAALLAQIREEQAAGFERHKDNPRALAGMEEIVQMLHKWDVEQFESGRYNGLLALIWQNGHDSGEDFGMSWSYWAEHNGGAEPVREENPYGI